MGISGGKNKRGRLRHPLLFLNNIEISLSYMSEQDFFSKNMTFVMFLD
jgi:hypothetical protein